MQVRLEELGTRKQDADKALTLEDVNAAAGRAVDHADRRADNIMKSIGGAGSFQFIQHSLQQQI